MLHGCTQDPDDFAVGTQMNACAEAHDLVVAYPGQPSSANANRCWNWFSRTDQRRGGGEAALLAELTLFLRERHQVDRQRVFVAGISAGGAMAAALAEAYPDVFRAVGVHSGVPPGTADNLLTAVLAMKGMRKTSPAENPLPTIVFHGDKDSVVHPRNAEMLMSRLSGWQPLGPPDQGRRLFADHQGVVRAEQWMIAGMGHAWSGGSPAGSYTYPAGPDASAEMVRFFLTQT